MERKEQFKKDLNFGSWGEEILMPWIRDYFNRKDFHLSYWWNSEKEADELKLVGVKRQLKLKEYDLKFGYYPSTTPKYPTKYVTFEIKTDKYEDTGNVCFERSDNGKKSGVFSTKSDYFIYFFPRYRENNLYIIKSEKLRGLLEMYNNYITYGGDLGKTANYIIRKEDFNDNFKKAGGRIETFTPTIPEKYNLKTFEKVGGRTIYRGDDISNKDLDVFKF